jgi:hypothetical protein
METATAAIKTPAIALTNNERSIIAPAVLFGRSDARRVTLDLPALFSLVRTFLSGAIAV